MHNKTWPNDMLSTGESLKIQSWLKVKGWKKIFYVNNNQKSAEVAALILDKMYFK